MYTRFLRPISRLCMLVPWRIAECVTFPPRIARISLRNVSKIGFHSRSSLDRRPFFLRLVSASSLPSSLSPAPRIHQQLGPLLGRLTPTLPCPSCRLRRVPLLFLHLCRLAPSRLGDVDCLRAQFGPELEDAQAVELRDACTGVDVPSVWGTSTSTTGRWPSDDENWRGVKRTDSAPANATSRQSTSPNSVLEAS